AQSLIVALIPQSLYCFAGIREETMLERTTVPEATRRKFLAAMPRLRIFINSLRTSREDREELLQETLLKAWTKLHYYEDENMAAWLVTIAKHLYMDTFRREKSRATAEKV